MQKVITCILAAMPTYFSLFMIGPLAALVLSVSTMGGLIAGATLTDKDGIPMHLFRLGWVIHLIGICLSVAFHNL